MFLTATIRDDDGKALGVMVLNEKTFSSGRVGWFGQAKLEIEGERYQAQGQLVKIGNPDAKQVPEREARGVGVA